MTSSPVEPSPARRPWPAIVVAVVLVLAAGYTLLLGLVASALAGMDSAGMLSTPGPLATGAVLALALVAAAVLAVRGHRGRWWVLGLSALPPAAGVILAVRAGELPKVVIVFVVGWLILASLAHVRPLRQWWARTP